MDAKKFKTQLLANAGVSGLFHECVVRFRSVVNGNLLTWSPDSSGCKGACTGTLTTTNAINAPQTDFMLRYDANTNKYTITPQSAPDVVWWILGGGNKRPVGGTSVNNPRGWPFEQSQWILKPEKWNDKDVPRVATTLSVTMDKNFWHLGMPDNGPLVCTRNWADKFFMDFVSLGQVAWGTLIPAQPWMQQACCLAAKHKNFPGKFTDGCNLAKTDCTVAIRKACPTIEKLASTDCAMFCTSTPANAKACDAHYTSLCKDSKNRKKAACVCGDTDKYQKYVKESKMPGPPECVFPPCVQSAWGKVKGAVQKCPDTVTNIQQCINKSDVGSISSGGQLATKCNMTQANTTSSNTNNTTTAPTTQEVTPTPDATAAPVDPLAPAPTDPAGLISYGTQEFPWADTLVMGYPWYYFAIGAVLILVLAYVVT